MSDLKIDALVGKTIVDAKNSGEEIDFLCSDGSKYRMHHINDCCESVSVEDICGDLSDLYGSPILDAREETNSNVNPPGVPNKEYQDSFTWTFYILRNINATVTIRWYGESNGYYSESVDFVQVTP
jgi:hypothetical protein